MPPARTPFRPTLRPLFGLAGALLLWQGGPAPAAAPARPDARATVREALRAVEGDTAARAAARWAARLARDPRDRLAALGLATLARLTYDYPAAERRYGPLLADSARAGAAGGAPPDRVAVYARLGTAQALDTRGLLAEAGAAFERARHEARRAGEHVAEADALVALSFIRAQAAGVDVGFATLDSAQRLLPAAALDARGELLRRRALLHAVLGHADSAAALAARCEEVARRAGEPRTEALCLRSQALNLKFQGLDDSALVVLRTIERLQRRTRDHAALSETLLRRTDPLLARGDYGAVKATLVAALTEAELSRNDLAVGSVYTGLGTLAIRVGDYTAADQHLRHAVARFAAQRDTNDLVNAVAYQSTLALALGDLARARELGRRVIAWDQRIGDLSGEFDAWRQLAAIEIEARDWPAAARALAEARALARRHERPLWLTDLAADDGRLALRRGDPDGAERALGVYLAGLDSSQHLQRHAARTHLAEAYARRGDAARAERELTAAGDELDRWRAGLADRELRVLAFQTSAGEHHDRDASVARVLATLVGAGRVAPAFALAERRRARELADRLLQGEALGTDSVAAAGAHRHETHATPATRALTVEAAQAALPDDRTALLEYVAGADDVPLTLFVVTRQGVTARVLPAGAAGDSLAERIGRFVALLEGGADPRGLARALGATLLDPVLGELGPAIDRLVVVPDGPLHRLPFDALRLADGRYALERYTVSLAPSAAVLGMLRERGARRTGGEPAALLAFGDPAFAAEADGFGLASIFRGAGNDSTAVAGLPRLPASGAEARGVARYAAHSEVRLRDDASEAWLKRAPLSRFRILHFATHALVDEQSPARTALALAPGDGDDGFLTPADLAALDLDADLVVLSACRTAGGRLVEGEGVDGLTAPLLEAGARSVVATRWRIPDRSTVRLVDDFYAALARGRPVAAALREAKLAALARGAPAGEWAAFAALGDPLAQPVLVAPMGRGGRWWAAVGVTALGVIGVGGGLVWRGRRRRGLRAAAR